MKTAKAFEVSPDRVAWGKANSVEAVHARRFPSIRCSVCGVWATTGINYPSTPPGLLNDELPPANSSPLAVDQFRNLVAKVQPLFGKDRPLVPAAGLGPLSGKAKGNFGDFAWVNSWTPLLRKSIWQAAEEAGLSLVGVLAELSFEQRSLEPFVEIEARPSVRLASSLLPERCVICGRLPITMPDKLSLAALSFDSSIPLQRVAELPTVLIANESFARFVESRKLRDVILKPVEVR